MIANALIAPAPPPRVPNVPSSGSTDFDRQFDSAARAATSNRHDARSSKTERSTHASGPDSKRTDSKATDGKNADGKPVDGTAREAGMSPTQATGETKAPAHTGELPAELLPDAEAEAQTGDVAPDALPADLVPADENVDGESTGGENTDGANTDSEQDATPVDVDSTDAAAQVSAQAGATGASAVTTATTEGEAATGQRATAQGAVTATAAGTQANAQAQPAAQPAQAGAATATAAQSGATTASAAETQSRAEAAPTAAPVPTTTSTQATSAAPASAAPTAHTPPQPLPAQLAPQLAHLRQLPQGQHVLTITVNPEHYGPVRVVAHITPEGTSMQLISPTEAGREALRGSLADLRRDLAEAGFDGDLDLDLGTEAETSDDGPAGADTDAQHLGRAVQLTAPDHGTVAQPTTTRGSLNGVDLYL